jgi:uncharacterized protein YndB with AHSA1/START domain
MTAPPPSGEQRFEWYIRSTPDELWHAIIDPAIRARYQFGVRMTSPWTPGSDIEVRSPDGATLLGTGQVLDVERPRRLVHTMVALWSDDVAAEGSTRVTWTIEPVGDSCRLDLVHDQLRDGVNEQITGGWPMILSGLKTWLETGTVLTTPGSLLYS